MLFLPGVWGTGEVWSEKSLRLCGMFGSCWSFAAFLREFPRNLDDKDIEETRR